MALKEDEKQDQYLLWGLTLCLTAAYAGLCFNDSVWADEAYTMLLVQKPWPEAWRLLLSDVHPPLYYVIVKLVCTVFGCQVPVVKGISVFFVFLTMLLGITNVYPDYGRKTALLYIAAAGLMPQLFRHGVELRMYPQAMFFVTACGLLAAALWKRRRENGHLWLWAGFWASGAAAAYTHYYGLVSVACIYGLLLCPFAYGYFREKRRTGPARDASENGAVSRETSENGAVLRGIRRWFLCVSASIAVYLPWLFVFAGQTSKVGESYWIERPSAGTAIRWAGWLFKTEAMPVSILYTAVFALGFFLLLKRGIAGRREDLLLGAAGYGILLLTVLTGLSATFLFRPVFIPRYMIPAAGLAAFGLAVFGAQLPRRLAVLLCGLMLLTGGLGYRDVWKEEYEIRTAETRSELEQLFKPGDRLAYDYAHIGLVLEYYYPDYEVEYWADADWNGSGDIWYCQCFDELTEERMDEMGLDWTFVGEYGLDEYRFRLYRIWREEKTDELKAGKYQI